ncbi:MAG: LytTR family transcriptional regulator [Clostridiales Family XIII bacterium]|jgi:DNA-binding LytR/AlgR family response regulator|nr:LytTR family transcriptional regulator [Clostridiales Family XIII bacterium]
MKIRIDIDDTVNETEVTIRCKTIDAKVAQMQKMLSDADATNAKIRLTKAGREYYLMPEDILFFEAQDGHTWAHTTHDAFESKLRLYELEALLPHSFLRVSKSAIVGTEHIYAIEKNPFGPSTVEFRDSHKKISVSRQYFRILYDKLNGAKTR